MRFQVWTGMGMVVLCAVMVNPNVDAAVHEVQQSGFTFDPASVTVEPGDTVRWIHASGSHTVTSGASCVFDGTFDEPLSAANPIVEYLVPGDASGTIDYFCIPHCSAFNMVGQIEVVPPVNCPEDLDGLNGVGQGDLNAVLNRWGDPACDPGGAAHPCPEDLDGLNGVGQGDLNAVLNRWGDPDCE